MPGGDRTGPEGRGSRTGRGRGDCVGAEQPRFFGGGLGRGGRRWTGLMRRARWLRWGWEGPETAVDEIALLKEESEELQARLKAVQQRLTEIEQG